MLVFCVQGGDHVVDFFHMTTAANGFFVHEFFVGNQPNI